MRNVFHFDPDTVDLPASPSLPEAMDVGERPLHVEVGWGRRGEKRRE